MATIVAGPGPSVRSSNTLAGRALKWAAAFWFMTAAAGQLVFAVYIAAFFGGNAARGELSNWNEVLAHGIIPADVTGNAALVIHLALALAITLSGPLQLVPAIRTYFPTFHRWNGRIYVVTAIAISLAALYLIWARNGLPGWSLLSSIAISINALLIMMCASLAWRYARARDFARHRRWALRLFLAVSGVWFLRIGVMLWIIANSGPAGLGENLGGPAGICLTFAQYLVPLAILEVYFKAQRSPGPATRLLMAAGLAVLTLAMGLGIVLAAGAMWLPHI